MCFCVIWHKTYFHTEEVHYFCARLWLRWLSWQQNLHFQINKPPYSLLLMFLFNGNDTVVRDSYNFILAMNVPEEGPDFQGITHLSLSGKVYFRMLKRRRQLFVEAWIEEEQCGFCPDFGTVDQIFTFESCQAGHGWLTCQSTSQSEFGKCLWWLSKRHSMEGAMVGWKDYLDPV